MDYCSQMVSDGLQYQKDIMIQFIGDGFDCDVSEQYGMIDGEDKMEDVAAKRSDGSLVQRQQLDCRKGLQAERQNIVWLDSKQSSRQNQCVCTHIRTSYGG